VTGDSLILWGDTQLASPWVLAVWTCLREKGVPFRLSPLDLERGEHRTGEYPERSLTGKVPTLQRGDFWLSESMAIIEYLDEAFPAPRYRPSLPPGIEERARARQLMAWVRSDLFEIRRCLPFEGLFEPMKLPPWSEGAEREAREQVRIAAGRARAGAAERPLPGDFDLAFMLRRLLHYGVTIDGMDGAVTDYADRIWERPSVQSWVGYERPVGGEVMIAGVEG
jgi:glutathione S-transferase